MEHEKNILAKTLTFICSFLLIFALGGQSVLLAFGDKAGIVKNFRPEIEITKESIEAPPTDASILPVADFAFFDALKTGGATNIVPQAGVDLGTESEPNGTIAAADALTGAEGRIKGNIGVAGDIDYYSFTATAGDRIYAGVITTFSATSSTANSVLEIRNAADASLETDLDDGSFGATSSGIAGFTVPSTGTYYFRVRENGVGATNLIRPYYLYFAVRTGAPTAEAESNNTSGTANPLAASGWMNGTVNPAADVDYYAVTLAAGDTVFMSLNLDPERDNVQWNGRLGFGLFGTANNTLLFANDGSVGSVANPLSETHVFTVKNAGTYFIYVDENAAGGAATFTYNVSATVFPAPSTAGCTTYTNSTPTPIADLALSSSTIAVPATTNRIRDINVNIVATHTFFQDVDWHLRSPAGNDNGLFTDVGNATTGGPETALNLKFDDEAAIPPSFAAIVSTMGFQPELAYRLDWFDGENPSGIWTLDMRDDATGDVGTLTSWSLEICEEPAPAGNLIYSEDFESGMGGFTHNGTADEWEYGTPATAATGVAPARAAFLNCASGTNCWKTDLDATYENSSSQDLVSPNLNLINYPGTINLYWAMKYQMESATFDHAFVTVREVGNPANSRIVWEWNGSTMSDTVGNPAVQIGESAGWGRYSANISDFAGDIIEVVFHVDSDTTVLYPGMAIDDVQIYQLGPVAANVPVSGRVVDAKGNAIARAFVSLTGSNGVSVTVRTNTFGYYRFDAVEIGETYILNATAKGYTFAPGVVTVEDEIADADIVALE